MKLNLNVKCASKSEWLDMVMNDFNSFLQDHADCERKAAAMAMSFVAKYPDRKEIIPELIETGIEELEHFQQVYQLMAKRNILLRHSIREDPYVSRLIKMCHSGRNERFLDRLLIASALETRGAERFKMVADAVTESELQQFYKMLWISEAKHGHLFVKMSLFYFPEDQVYERLEWWMNRESEVIESLEISPALH